MTKILDTELTRGEWRVNASNSSIFTVNGNEYEEFAGCINGNGSIADLVVMAAAKDMYKLLCLVAANVDHDMMQAAALQLTDSLREDFAARLKGIHNA